MGGRVERLAVRQGRSDLARAAAPLRIDDDRIDRLVAAGWLVRVHQGVYGIGVLTPQGVLFAAQLALGPRAAISHHRRPTSWACCAPALLASST